MMLTADLITMKKAYTNVLTLYVRSEEFTQYLSVSSTQQLHNIDALDAHRDRQQRTLKRNLSSGKQRWSQQLAMKLSRRFDLYSACHDP